MPVEFQKVNGNIRSVYRQSDGSSRLADDCICWWGVKKLECPIDEHAIAARQRACEEPVETVQDAQAQVGVFTGR